MVTAGQPLPHFSLHVASFTKVKPTKADDLEVEETTQVILILNVVLCTQAKKQREAICILQERTFIKCAYCCDKKCAYVVIFETTIVLFGFLL